MSKLQSFDNSSLSTTQVQTNGTLRLSKLKNIVQSICNRIGQDNFAYLIISIAVLLFPLPFVYTSYYNFHPIQMNLLRGLTSTIILIPILPLFGIDLDFKQSHNNKYLLMRNIIMLVQQMAYTAMHYVVSLPVLNILSISGSIFVFVLDYFLHGVKISGKQLVGIVAGILGVLVTVNGEFIMSILDPQFPTQSDFQNYLVQDLKLKILFGFLYILVSLLWTYGLILQKQLKGVLGVKIVYHQGIIFALGTAVLYPSTVSHPIQMSDFLWGCLISGVTMIFVQILFVSAYNISKNAGILTMLCMLSIVTSYLISILKYHEEVNPICVLGLLLLCFGLIKIITNGTKSADH